MVHKKKYRIGFYILFLTLSLLLLSTFSTCFASVSNESVKYYLDTIYDHSTFSSSYDFKTYLNNYKNNESNITDLTNKINTFLTNQGYENLNERNMISFIQISSSNFYIYFTFSNCSVPNGYNDLGFLTVTSSSFSNYNAGDKILIYRTGLYRTGAVLADYTDVVTNTGGTVYTAYNNQINSEISLYTGDNFVGTGLPSVYYNNYPVILKNTYGNYQIITPEPEEPSGDIPNSTGTITNNSGETTGKIDLSGIENGINGVKEQISGDSQKIINSISGETQKLINTITSQPDMDNTTITSGDILENFSFMSDPYENFWWDFIDGVELALLGSVRQLPVNWLGYQRLF